jgi:hypothetical protein
MTERQLPAGSSGSHSLARLPMKPRLKCAVDFLIGP